MASDSRRNGDRAGPLGGQTIARDTVTAVETGAGGTTAASGWQRAMTACSACDVDVDTPYHQGRGPIVEQLSLLPEHSRPEHLEMWAYYEKHAARKTRAWLASLDRASMGIRVPKAPDYSAKGVDRWLKGLVGLGTPGLYPALKRAGDRARTWLEQGDSPLTSNTTCHVDNSKNAVRHPCQSDK